MMEWRIGNGRVGRFRVDNWMREGVLASCYSRRHANLKQQKGDCSPTNILITTQS